MSFIKNFVFSVTLATLLLRNTKIIFFKHINIKMKKCRSFNNPSLRLIITGCTSRIPIKPFHTVQFQIKIWHCNFYVRQRRFFFVKSPDRNPVTGDCHSYSNLTLIRFIILILLSMKTFFCINFSGKKEYSRNEKKEKKNSPVSGCNPESSFHKSSCLMRFSGLKTII